MKIFVPFFLLAMVVSCKSGPKTPDVSGIQVTVRIQRFDKAFFSLDSNEIVPGLYQLNHDFPYFTSDFLANILGAGIPSDTNQVVFQAARQFLVSYRPVKDSLEEKFRDVSWLENDLRRSFQFVKYYFPKYELPPKVVTYIGPFDAPGVAMTRYTLAIGLQLYAGRNFSFYHSQQGQELFPEYISRRFEPNFILPNSLRAIAEDMYPDKSGNRPLVEQMIEKGKYWWLVQKLCPDCPDSLITGFTQAQLKWAQSNEGLIWNTLMQGDLFTIDPDIIKNFVGEAPHTEGMPDASPGNIGPWVGWQIVKKFESTQNNSTLDQIIRTDPRKILDQARYKPR